MKTKKKEILKKGAVSTGKLLYTVLTIAGVIFCIVLIFGLISLAQTTFDEIRIALGV